MAISLQDQLLKAGLVDGKKAKQTQKDKRKQVKLQHKGQAQKVDQNELARQKEQRAKADKDRQLNLKLKEKADKKALVAQIKQLIEMNSQTVGDGAVPYSFSHDGKIKKIYVDEKMQLQLSKGRLAIVELEGKYELVPGGIAEKILLRDEARVILFNERKADEDDEDDPYAEYQIPDDLMW